MHINSRGCLEVWCAELEGQLMTGAGPSFVIVSALTQNEMVVVEVEFRSVVEQHLADLAVECMLVHIDLDVELLESLGGGLPEFDEAMLAGEAIRLQQNLVLAVMNYIGREVLGVRMLAYVCVHGSHGTPIYSSKLCVASPGAKLSRAIPLVCRIVVRCRACSNSHEGSLQAPLDPNFQIRLTPMKLR